MTYYQETLLEEAKDMWERGHKIPLTLFAEMAAAGLDVLALEDKYLNQAESE